jgi:organic radical activating enzyme
MTPFMGDPHPNSLCEFKWPERPEFWEDLKQYPNIEEIYINGGEPTLMKQHWKFLEDLIDSGRSKGIKLWYSVNMTRMPDEIKMWKEFKAVKIEASIDDLKHRNHYIRYPTQWEDVLTSIERLNDHDVHWGIMQTITPMNVYYMAEFRQWARDQEAWVSYNFVKDPNYLDVRFIPQELKWELMRMMPNVVLDPADFTCVAMTLDRYWETTNTKLPNYWDKFCEFNRNLDILRGESFQETFPEFCEMLTKLDLEIP